MMNGKHRGVEQLVARRAHNPKVGGSSPPPATTYADVAQSAERILGKDKVTSSILVISSILKLDFLTIGKSFLFVLAINTSAYITKNSMKKFLGYLL